MDEHVCSILLVRKFLPLSHLYTPWAVIYSELVLGGAREFLVSTLWRVTLSKSDSGSPSFPSLRAPPSTCSSLADSAWRPLPFLPGCLLVSPVCHSLPPCVLSDGIWPGLPSGSRSHPGLRQDLGFLGHRPSPASCLVFVDT